MPAIQPAECCSSALACFGAPAAPPVPEDVGGDIVLSYARTAESRTEGCARCALRAVVTT